MKMTQEESISESLIGSVIRVLLRVAFAFEPLAPTAITVLMNQQLHRFKEAVQSGIIKLELNVWESSITASKSIRI